MRPLGVGEVLDVAINLYFRNWRRLLTIAAVVAVPVVIVTFLLDTLAFAEVDRFDHDAAQYQFGDTFRILDQTRFQTILIIETIVGAIAYLLVIGAVFRAVGQVYVGRDAEVGPSVGFAARRLHSLLWIAILLGVVLGLAFILLVGVLGILGLLLGLALIVWLFVRWSVAVPALMVEDVRGGKALQRSARLAKGHWWRTFAALLVGFIFIALFQFLIELLFGAADGLASESILLWAGVYDVLSGIATIITAPLQAAIVTVLYYDLRVRGEGFDVELLTRGLEEGSSPPPEGATTMPPAPSSTPPPPPPYPPPAQ